MSDVSKEAMAALSVFERDLDEYIQDYDLCDELLDAGLVFWGDEGPGYADVLIVSTKGIRALQAEHE